MASNVYTKNEILQTLASKGYFIDAYTLDTFFAKWKIEAIFEDEQGSEFYDKNALDLVLSNLFSDKNDEVKNEENNAQEEAKGNDVPAEHSFESNTPQDNSMFNQTAADTDLKIDDSDTSSLLENISLSDGTSLMDKIQTPGFEAAYEETQMQPDYIADSMFAPAPRTTQPPEMQDTKMGILEGAMISAGKEFTKEPVQPQEIMPGSGEAPDFDDISLLSESLEAQEKFREYVMSELSKKNVDLTPKSNEFKLDISERTLNMIARSMAKKIAKHVSSICSQDAKSAAELSEVQEQNKKLESRTKELEEQNKKLRLLLAESNKNLNSYKPSIFGLYKKVNPGK